MLTPEQQESKDAVLAGNRRAMARLITQLESTLPCLLYTSDAADDLL